MPRGVPGTGKGARKVVTEQHRRLLEARAEIDERLAVLDAKAKGHAAVLALATKWGLSPTDLRNMASEMGRRSKGDAPVVSLNLVDARRKALGRKIKEARKAKGMTYAAIMKAVGVKSTGSMSQWESGTPPSRPEYRARLIKVLDLPKDFFAEVPSRFNGAAGTP